MKLLLLLLCIFAVSFSTPLNQNLFKDLFSQWKISHSKSYQTEHEENHRFLVFKDNYLKIILWNQQRSDVVLALNEFADLTSEEFKTRSSGFIPSQFSRRIHHPAPVQDFPPVVDWREKGAVTPVKNQGSCGSCWAFSATGALEGFYFVQTGKLLSFSEQLIVDCVTDAYGCDGGFPEDAFQYTSLNGIEIEDDYPYKGVDQECQYDADKAIFVNAGYADIDPKNITAFKTTLIKQPVSVGIQADQIVFQFYKAGVITNFCGDDLNHGVLVVGYDIVLGIEAFIVKNSWGTNWGQKGYVYISTNPAVNNGNGVCGILAQPSVPLNQ